MKQTVVEILAQIEPELAACEASQIESIKVLSSIDCGTGNLEGNAEVARAVDELLSTIDGIQIRHIQTLTLGIMVVATLNEGCAGGKVIINGHLDTVFRKGDCANNPFHIEGDTGYGLGSVDCKSGLVVAIEAVRILQKTGLLPEKEIKFLFNCDEEIGTPECRNYIREEAEGAEAALVFEPARENDGVLTSRKGQINFTIECTGKNAHSGNDYRNGRSAVIELAQKIMYLYEHNDDARGLQFNMTGIADGGRPFNIVPDYAKCEVSVRFLTEEDRAWVFERLEELKKPYIEGCITTYSCAEDRIIPAMARTEGNVKLYEFVKEIGKEMGLDLEEQHSGGSGDAGIFTTMGIPCIDALGPHMYKIHALDECFKVSSIKERTRLTACILASM